MLDVERDSGGDLDELAVFAGTAGASLDEFSIVAGFHHVSLLCAVGPNPNGDGHGAGM